MTYETSKEVSSISNISELAKGISSHLGNIKSNRWYSDTKYSSSGKTSIQNYKQKKLEYSQPL